MRDIHISQLDFESRQFQPLPPYMLEKAINLCLIFDGSLFDVPFQINIACLGNN